MTTRVTLKSIASKVGVSSATVSHALNGRLDQVSAKTMREVIQAARDLGYAGKVPPAPCENGTANIGVIASELVSPLHMDAISGIEELATRFGFGMLLRRCGSDPDAAGTAVKTLVDRHVAGVILVVSSRFNQPQSEFQVAVDSGIPIVVINRIIDPQAALHIVSQNEQGSYQATQHLIKLGHTQIGCIHLPITGPMATMAGVERLQGFKRALHDFGIEEVPEWIKQGTLGVDAGFATGYTAMVDMLAKDPRPTGIVCGSDKLAFGAMKAAYELGLHIPDDLAIVGFDDSPGVAHSHPALSSVRQPMYAAGQRAMEVLVQHLWQGVALRGVERLPCELVVRASTTPHLIR